GTRRTPPPPNRQENAPIGGARCRRILRALRRRLGSVVLVGQTFLSAGVSAVGNKNHLTFRHPISCDRARHHPSSEYLASGAIATRIRYTDFASATPADDWKIPGPMTTMTLSSADHDRKRRRGHFQLIGRVSF